MMNAFDTLSVFSATRQNIIGYAKFGLLFAWQGAGHRRRLHRGSGKIAPVPAEQPGQKYHFAPVLFCLQSVIKGS